VWDCPRSRRTNLHGILYDKVKDWYGVPSVDQSSSRMAAACGRGASGGAQLFSSPCPSRSRRTHNLPSCSLVVATLCSLNGLSYAVSTRQSSRSVRRSRPCSSDERKLAGSCSHTLRRRGFPRPYKTVLRSIRTCRSIAKWQFCSAAADLGESRATLDSNANVADSGIRKGTRSDETRPIIRPWPLPPATT